MAHYSTLTGLQRPPTPPSLFPTPQKKEEHTSCTLKPKIHRSLGHHLHEDTRQRDCRSSRSGDYNKNRYAATLCQLPGEWVCETDRVHGRLPPCFWVWSWVRFISSSSGGWGGVEGVILLASGGPLRHSEQFKLSDRLISARPTAPSYHLCSFLLDLQCFCEDPLCETLNWGFALLLVMYYSAMC